MKTALVSAQNPTEIYVINPQNPLNPLAKDGNFVFYTNTTSVGYKFNATVWVYNVTDLYSYQVKLAYDPGPLNVTRAWVPNWDPQWVFYGKDEFWLSLDIVWEYGSYVKIGAVLLPPETAFSGTGILAVIEFEILDHDFAPTPLGKVFRDLTIDNEDTYLLDSSMLEISTTKVNGYYEFFWLEPGLEVKPSKYVAETQMETFNITVWLNNVTTSDRLVSVEFKLRYNATLLNVTKVTELSFLAGFGTTTFSYVDDNVENLTIVNSLNPPYDTNFPKGDGAIANITFQSIYQGVYPEENNCTLELIDPPLFLDDGGKNITFTPSKNGFYKILSSGKSYITINVSPASVVVGSNVTISGNIKPSKVDVNVTIYYRQTGQSWLNLTTVKTGSESNYTYVWTTTQAGTFELKANWTGDVPPPIYGAESDVATLTVKKNSSAITIDVNPPMVTVGENVTISGAINVSRIGVDVTILYRLAGGTFSALSTVQTNGTSQYNFTWTTTEGGNYELYASWLGDNVTLGAESPKTALTVKKFPSSITLNVNPFNTTVIVGSKISMSGTVTANGTPKSGVDVTICLYYYDPDLNATMTDRIAVKTDSNGNYNYTWTATKRNLAENDTFFFYADWLGDKTTSGNYSFLVPWLTVGKIQSIITINVDSSTITIDSNVTISGAITPAKANVNVTIYYREKGTTVQSSLLAKTNSEGHYNYTWEPLKNATFELYAWWGGDENTYSNESDIVTLKVNLARSSITLSAYPEVATVGSNITIRGTLNPNKTGVEVSIYYRLSAANEIWVQLEAAKTDLNGNYSYTWTTTKSGTYELEASWSGDNLTEPAKSEIEIVKIEEPFSLITYIPYITGGIAIVIIALAVIYLTKIRKR